MSNRLANNFQFIDVGRNDPDKRPLRSRKTEYKEIYKQFTRDQVAEQSHRCLECGNPYCAPVISPAEPCCRCFSARPTRAWCRQAPLP